MTKDDVQDILKFSNYISEKVSNFSSKNDDYLSLKSQLDINSFYEE